MAPGSRHLHLGDARPAGLRSRSIQPSTATRRARAGAAGLEFANDLLGRRSVSLDTAEQALERLRLAALAIEVTFWRVTDIHATCVLRVGEWGFGESLPQRTLKTRAISEQLRRRELSLCGVGEVSGLEDLAPALATSYAVISTVSDEHSVGVLVIGWDALQPPCDETSLAHLQIAAGALARTLRPHVPLPPDNGAPTPIGSRLAAAQEEERSRIARELHDDLGQQTALLAAKLETLLRSSNATVDTLRRGIGEAQQSVQDLAVSIHTLSHQLHPPKLKLLGLVKTIESLCRNVAQESHIDVAFRSTRVPAGVPDGVSLCICRVAQEALQNAVKHSGAQHIDVALTATERHVTLRVSDKGRGFDVRSTSSRGIGLITMRERVELNGGRLHVHAAPSNGAVIEAIVPLAPAY